MTAPTRPLQFDTEQQVIDEITRLRRGYRQAGNWNLAQICWHVGRPIALFLAPPEPMDIAPTPEQAQKKAGFVDYIVTHRKAPPGVKDAPPPMVPPPTAGPADIDQYLAQLDRLRDYPHPKVMMGPVGPVTAAEFRACNLFHATHHLAFLVPVERRALRYPDFNAVKTDVQNLRTKDYQQLGNWTLSQIAWHLNKAFEFPLNTPATDPTDEQRAFRPALEQFLSTGSLPAGIKAPDIAVPPATANDSDVDALLATLDRAAAHNRPAQHRRFGPLTAEEFHRLSLLHCAHHLSYLLPAAELGTGN
jgi:hypothetical protein